MTTTVGEKRPGGRRVQKRSREVSRVQLVSLSLGALLTGAAWVFLVGAAIDFGVLAVSGQGTAWLFTVGASTGAVVCLVLLIALVARGLRMVGLLSEYRPRRAERRKH
ncbi:MAG TPA: hypothetical protein VFR87_11510 [Nocardioidaceae bacterium]|nr:hypothetical protein [Nocardioidaceae bacterium]